MPLSVRNIDIEEDRGFALARIRAVEEANVASQRKYHLLIAAIAVDGEECGHGIVYVYGTSEKTIKSLIVRIAAIKHFFN